MAFHSSQLRDMNAARSTSDSEEGDYEGGRSGDTGMTESAMSDTSLGESGRSVLELEPQSYARREETEADRASKFQQRLRKTQEDFTVPGGVPQQQAGGGAAEQGFSGRMKTAPRGEQAQQEGESDQMARYRQMEEQKAKAMIDMATRTASAAGGAVGKGVSQAMQITEKLFGPRALLALGAKWLMFSSGFAILPLLALMCFVNLEALHIFFPFIRLSPAQETKWMMKGLDLSSPKKGMYKLVTLLVAALVDLSILVLLGFVALIIYAIIYICNLSTWDIVKAVTGQ